MLIMHQMRGFFGISDLEKNPLEFKLLQSPLRAMSACTAYFLQANYMN